MIVIMMETTAYSQMVSMTLTSKSAPQPAMIATPAGGTVCVCRGISTRL